LLTHSIFIAGTDPFLSATLAPEDDASMLTPTPSAQKTRKAMKAMSFEDMGQFIWPTCMLFADPFYRNCRHRSVHFCRNSSLSRQRIKAHTNTFNREDQKDIEEA
jgi:hypothetical protein